ncbi:vacuolar transporter chaperone [Ascosphaera pollenicola]|nr:vacuolar transporter chaperone [Ascosphaera pollenicola]
MPGGFLHFLWRPYGLYGRVDFMYGWPEYRAGNGFVAAQSTLNLVEVVGYMYYLVTVYNCSDVRRRVEEGRKRAGREEEEREAKRDTCWVFSSKNSLGGREGVIALLVIFACSVMTVSKTVLYGLVEAFSNFRDVGHNSPARLILLWLIPNGLWVVFPSYAAYYFASEILNALQTVTGVPAKEKTRRIKAL